MTESSKQIPLSREYIEKTIEKYFESNSINSKKEIISFIKNSLLSDGFTEVQIKNKLSIIGKIIDNKQFSVALNIIKKTLENTGTIINCENYDGLIVKKLPDSDIVTNNKNNRKSGQTDIRPTKNQENIFPYLLPPKCYVEDSNVYNSLKNYFLFQISVNIFESNLNFLKNKQKSSIEENILKSYTTVLKDNRNRLEISSQFTLDGEYFKELRNLLYEDDYLIFLKRKEKFDYDCFGIKIKDNVTGDYLYNDDGGLLVNEDNGLKNLSGFFYYFDSMTFITEDMFNEKNSNSNNNVGENLLLYGVPGCGKSWTIKNKICKDVDEFYIERVVFHPDYTYSDFVGQILPNISSDELKYKFECGPFTKILKKAHDHPSDHFFLIIEEINRGNAPAIFGDIFQLLDRRKDDDGNYKKGSSEFGITNSEIANKVYGDTDYKVRIPSNLSIIATMNTSDQNVFTLDTAFKRRWHMEMIENDFDKPKFKNMTVPNSDISWKVFGTAINEIILEDFDSTLSSEDKRLGAYFVDEKDLSSPKRFAEKVLLYLWDDVFKFSRENYFNKNVVNQFSLECFIKEFENNQAKNYFKVFTPRVSNKIMEVNVKEINTNSHNGNENDSS